MTGQPQGSAGLQRQLGVRDLEPADHHALAMRLHRQCDAGHYGRLCLALRLIAQIIDDELLQRDRQRQARRRRQSTTLGSRLGNRQCDHAQARELEHLHRQLPVQQCQRLPAQLEPPDAYVPASQLDPDPAQLDRAAQAALAVLYVEHFARPQVYLAYGIGKQALGMQRQLERREQQHQRQQNQQQNEPAPLHGLHMSGPNSTCRR